MSYENPKIPEGINVTDEHPLKDFFAMLAGVGLVAAAVILCLILVSERLVRFIPFSTEQTWWSPADTAPLDAEQQQIRDALQSLAAALGAELGLPDEMTITVHYRAEPVVNAYATLGGHITLYQGLIEKLDSENALAMLLAHEIAHVQHRDPIVALGRGVALGLVLSAVTGIGSDVVGNRVLAHMSTLSQLSFNRSQERAADAAALQAVYRRYGHVAGVGQLFQTLQEQHRFEPPPLLSTHPLTRQRIEAIEQFAREHPDNGARLTPLPAALRIQPSEPGR